MSYLNKNVFVKAISSTLIFFLIGCEESSRIDYPGDNSHNAPDHIIERWWDDPSDLDVPAEAITVAEAITICKNLTANEKSSQNYYIKGLVHSIKTASTTGATFNLVDSPTETLSQFQAYNIKNFGNTNFGSGVHIYRGNWVVIYGKLTNYNGGTYETASGEAYLYSSTYVDTNLTNDGSLAHPFTVADVNYLNGGKADKSYFVKGYIVGVSITNQNITSDSVLQLQPDANGKFSGATHYIIADDTTAQSKNQVVAVKLPEERARRDSLKLNDAANAAKFWHKEVLVYGYLKPFLSINGVIDCSYYQIGEEAWGNKPE